MPVRHLSAIAAVLAGSVALAADKIPDDQLKFFEAKIRPVLADRCYSCHSADSKKVKGGLLLDTRDGLRTGGDTGPALVAGNAKKSLILKALKGSDGVAVMPPKEKLPADVIADFEKWVNMGAPDPRDAKGATPAKPVDAGKGKDHWAFQPVKAVEPPKGTAWATTPVDQFVSAKWAEKNLIPVGDADRRTLLRRVYFDLTGLPPTPEQVDAFLKDQSPDAFEKVVDKLLASPAFGERWGRHWLDVARYAESSGKERNMAYPHAWRYRDYVIASFNADKPIDQFFKEQLAGDLMGGKDDTQKAERTIATGFLAVGPKSHAERNPRQFALDVADEQIDAMGQGMLGLTVACARCHDHKFDPIPTKDYYALAGIFTSTDTKVGVPNIVIARNGSSPLTLPADAQVTVPTGASKREYEELKKRLEDLKKRRDDAIEEAKKDKEPSVRLVGLQTQIAGVEGALDLYDNSGNPKKLAMGVKDKYFPKDMPVHTRGEVDKTGETVARGFVQVLGNAGVKIPRGESGRKELAEWVARASNPLTARVYVNRVWLHLFGKGIVATPDNFGTTGTPPSHPELLDYLASTFMKGGWSTKKLIRTLVLSHTYRLSSEHHAGNVGTDPEGVYLWRMNKRRLDAEALRDSMFAVAGELDTKPAVGSPVAKMSGLTQGPGRFGMLGLPTESTHRSVYLPLMRDHVPESLELFDFAEPNLVTGSREDTSVPAQGLYLLNNPQVMKLANATADRLGQKKNQSEAERTDATFRLVFGRPASKHEMDAASKFLHRFKQTEARSSKKASDVERAAWAALVQALFASAEFRYLD